LIAGSNWYFNSDKNRTLLATLFWPPSSRWIFCFVLGFVIGEALRRYLIKRAGLNQKNACREGESKQ
jgi:hypothetical protein